MDVLHFAAHNICRGDHSTPQRACAAVLKLSIVLAVMSLAFSSDLPGAREPRELKVRAEESAVSQLEYCSSARQQRLFESVACRIKSQKLVEMAMTWRGIEVKICQNKTQELVAFLKRNGAFFLSPTGFWTLLKFMFEHEYYTDIAMLRLCIGDS